MSVNPELRTLDIDIPAQPEALVRLSLLLAHENLDMPALAALIESDMALAAAVLKAVNASFYGLQGRVQSVQQAITYLGLREVTGITYEMGLRAAFPPAVELEPLWERAGKRGVAMGRLAAALDLDAWGAHSAGLFEECGKAVLFRHAQDHYRAMLRAATDDAALCELERIGFGVSHDALGAALCESWGLAGPAVASVRHHVRAWAGAVWPEASDKRAICALSVLANALLFDPDRLEVRAHQVAEPLAMEPEFLMRTAAEVQARFTMD
jgi:HD-like signal output (HDOD) protein